MQQDAASRVTGQLALAYGQTAVDPQLLDAA